jgi:hypothetical protein
MSFESLSNELLLDLFEFLSTTHLIRAFHGLNLRFNSLIYDHLQIHGINFSSVSKRAFDIICEQHLPSLANRIRSLCLSNSDDAPEQIDQLFDSGFTLCHFTHLRSLSLKHIHSLYLMDDIMSDLPDLFDLTHLILDNCGISFVFADGLSILNRIWSLPKLTHCYLNIHQMSEYQPPETIKVATVVSSTLEYLSILGWIRIPFDQVTNLFKNTPRLRNITFRGYQQSYESDIEQSPIFTSIKSLNLNCFDSFDDLLQIIPNLCTLKVHSEYPFINGERWEQMIIHYFPKLKKLQFKMKYIYHDENNKEKEFEEILSSFQSQFWLDEHRWFVQLDWQLKYNGVYVYTLPYADNFFSL